MSEIRGRRNSYGNGGTAGGEVGLPRVSRVWREIAAWTKVISLVMDVKEVRTANLKPFLVD